MTQKVKTDNFSIGGGGPFALICGPCVIEDAASAYQIAGDIKQICEKLAIPFIFKASYDKANRSSISSFRGPGIEQGLPILARIRRELGVPVLSDVHRISEVAAAARVLDILQIPAFLCRQTDLLVEAAKTGKPVNVKKGQFLAPWDINNVVEKLRFAGSNQILLTERGSMLGYNNLVADMRSIRIMQDTGCPVVFDATHSVQLPGGAGTASSGQREFAPILAKAAIAAGADAVFLEVHPEPDKALCDGPNALHLNSLESLLRQLKNIQNAILQEERNG
ncbi:MAG: 3-deoxy-8-phosphooctulonate synthase [Desulfosalsimonadaceae bacterium]